jgi:glucose-fructose oxidoreductase
MPRLPRSLVVLLVVATFTSSSAKAQTATPMRIALVGLVHGHTSGLLKFLPSHPEVTLVGIAEPDAALREKYKTLFHLPDSLFFTSEAELLDHTHPEAILVYTSPLAHRAAVEMAARHHVASMVEKPFSTTLEDALAMQRASVEYHVAVLVNYSTTWFPSNIAAADILSSGKIGDLRKIVVHDGHRGPKETGVSPEFFRWLTDPVENGAGALYDFGCYGVDLTTWLMHGEIPLTVTAITLHIKPEIYPKVDDDSTILLTYPHAQAIIQGSWNWPYDRKDMEIYGATGYVDTVRLDKLRVRLTGETDETVETAKPVAAPQNNPLNYLAAVLHGQIKDPNDPSGLDTNVKVMRILESARESARTGRTITMNP